MHTLFIDLETKSGADLKKCGVYRYAEDPEFDILLFGVSVDGGPVKCYDLASGGKLPDELIKALMDDTVIKWAFNASFERICISQWLRRFKESLTYLNPVSWRCSLVLCAYNGLPLSLEMAGSILGFEKQKLKEGHELIRYFCVPCKPTKANYGRTWNRPKDAPDKWEIFKKYNIRDVEVEMQIHRRLSGYMVPDHVWEEYRLDQIINDRGIRVDKDLVNAAIKIDGIAKDTITNKLVTLTGLDNPNSVMQMKSWLSHHGLDMETLGKKEVSKEIKNAPEEIQEVLSLRLQLAKSSVKKYQAMQASMCKDDRCHGMFMFYGANRSGRWAGRIVQLQNLPQNHMEDLADARAIVNTGNYDKLSSRYKNIPNVLSELIRTSFIPRDGYKFIVSDFSAIEARVLSYIAGETWRSDVFKNNGDIYCASASLMFHVPVEKHGINGHLRQKGKIAELALGYGGSVGALKSMGALDIGLSEEELKPLVDLWRRSNPKIVCAQQSKSLDFTDFFACT